MFRCVLVVLTSWLGTAQQTCSTGAHTASQENYLLQKTGMLTKVHALDLDVAQQVKSDQMPFIDWDDYYYDYYWDHTTTTTTTTPFGVCSTSDQCQTNADGTAQYCAIECMNGRCATPFNSPPGIGPPSREMLERTHVGVVPGICQDCLDCDDEDVYNNLGSCPDLCHTAPYNDPMAITDWDDYYYVYYWDHTTTTTTTTPYGVCSTSDQCQTGANGRAQFCASECLNGLCATPFNPFSGYAPPTREMLERTHVGVVPGICQDCVECHVDEDVYNNLGACPDLCPEWGNDGHGWGDPAAAADTSGS